MCFATSKTSPPGLALFEKVCPLDLEGIVRDATGNNSPTSKSQLTWVPAVWERSYQATDTKLGRSVAIKLLPEAFARDVERVARFEREARVLASLNQTPPAK